jgi:hypothetical protein
MSCESANKECLTVDEKQDVHDDDSKAQVINEECKNKANVHSHLSEVTRKEATREEDVLSKSQNGGVEGVEPSLPSAGDNQAKKKGKKREDRGIEHVLRALQNMETSEEKLTALCKKYTELLEEHRTMQNTIKQNQRTITVLSREKDQLQSEHSKAVLGKSKLEGLCRELQKHNKLIKDESTARAKEDEEKRKEVSNRFQTTINEIQQQMNDHYSKNTSLREENLELANKLKGLIEQYELREEHIDKILKTKEIEGQLFDAKLQQAALQMAEEKEKSLQDKQKLLQETMEAQKRILLLEQQEEKLKAQLNMYSEKYEDFQSTLSKSNDVFQSFKTEMEKMTKKIKKLEKETATWRQKWESSNKALVTLAEEKAVGNKEVALLQNKISKLESLCRALQEERRKYGNEKAAEITSSNVQLETVVKTTPLPEDNLSSNATASQDTLSPGLTTTLPTVSGETASNDAGPSPQVAESPAAAAVAKETAAAVGSSEGLTEATGEKGKEEEESGRNEVEVNVEKLSVQDSSHEKADDHAADLSATNAVDETSVTETPQPPASDSNL